MKKFIKHINFEPGYDYIYGIPKKDDKYGRHGMSIRFILKGEKGAVTFLMFTDWLPMVKEEGDFRWRFTYPINSNLGNHSMFPMAADIGYHSPKPLSDWQKKEKPREKCDFLGGKPCYYDGSGLYAEEFMAEFINKGEKALWKKMRGYYKETFES